MRTDKAKEVVLALYPNKRGIGYAILNGPEELIEYGQYHASRLGSAAHIKWVRNYLDYYEPTLVLLRADHEIFLKSERLKKLIKLIYKETSLQGREVHQYSRKHIQEVFSSFNSKSKFAISKKLIEWFPRLKAYAMPYRKEWVSEHTNAGIFDALSLAITHYYLVD
ncbi:hypothetical protein L0P88_13630 [Muricauda sp. SCSIO 64092]|uniref:hypothetical protein n=1 Tax=Allomuricauda sp. SCSIO 64092 TaxID=2908842 RepID=UPI001FF55A76|nr:hypothetical protein [Muricauda sp. SCSIO 64092]UOY04992.1 hypothetical protein L0P88_13630 [Muricauda sp. SCSIO 64092]